MSHPDSDLVRGIGVVDCCRAVAEAVTGAVRPRRPDRAVPVDEAPLPGGTTTVQLCALPQVPKKVATPVVAEGVWRPRSLRIGMRTFVVEHPEARILLDPSVATRPREQVLAEMPALLRAAVVPPADVLSTVEALHLAGIDPRTLDLALPTHLHWDHVSGLLDLPELPVRIHRPEWEWAMAGDLAPVAGVRRAVRRRPVEYYDLEGPPVLTFPRSHDVFGDGAVVLVDLAGHTPGSVGVLLRTARGWVLAAGDAAWHHLQVEACAQKAGFPGLLVDEDREAAYESLWRLHVVRDRVRVLPSHDHDLAAAWEA